MDGMKVPPGWSALAAQIVWDDWLAAVKGEDAPPLMRASNIGLEEYDALRTMPEWMVSFNGAQTSREVWAEWSSTTARLAAWAAVGAPVIVPEEPHPMPPPSPSREALFWWVR